MTAELPEMAIAVIQPWAHLIVHGLKDIENRDWFTRYRGPVAIHASKRMPQDQWDGALDMLEEIDPLDRTGTLNRRARIYNTMRLAGIVGVVDIVDCVTSDPSPWFVGAYGFKLANARPVPFIPVKGKQGFFRWRDRTVAEIAP
jgi:hypothetical protein